MENPDAVKHETVLDTGAEQLGKTYAQALLSAAQKVGSTEQIVEQLNQLVDEYLANNTKLREALASPRIDEDEKCRVIDRLFGEEFSPLLITFLKVMASRGRLGYIASVRDGAAALFDELSGQVLAKVTTAVPLDDALRSKIVEQLGNVLGKKVRLQEIVDTNVIGGMVIRIGDTVFDNSVANRIDVIARRTREGFSRKLMENFEKLSQ
jgi:F-type H+-transporting ATPase subunit delta